MRPVGGAQLTNAGLHMRVDGALGDFQISPISQADLPLATHRSISHSRDVSVGVGNGRRREALRLTNRTGSNR